MDNALVRGVIWTVVDDDCSSDCLYVQPCLSVQCCWAVSAPGCSCYTGFGFTGFGLTMSTTSHTAYQEKCPWCGCTPSGSVLWTAACSSGFSLSGLCTLWWSPSATAWAHLALVDRPCGRRLLGLLLALGRRNPCRPGTGFSPEAGDTVGSCCCQQVSCCRRWCVMWAPKARSSSGHHWFVQTSVFDCSLVMMGSWAQ